MYKNEKVAVVIAAAGKGTRMGSDLPKQFMTIGGEPMLLKTVKVFEGMAETDEIVLVADKEHTEYCRELMRKGRIDKVSAVVEGGSERQDSVFNALSEIEKRVQDTAYVLIHDAARPFVTEEVIRDVIKAAEKGAAVPCVPVKDSLRMLRDGTGISASVDRDLYLSVQTPQGFRLKCIMDAYRKAFKEGFYGTDDGVLAERAGYDPVITEGDYRNIKITTKEDLPMENRVGTGFDVHAFAEDRDLILGGVKIPYERGLAGHSDADVLLHALMDALLGAAALGDIGHLFPDTCSEYKDISSLVLLRRVGDLMRENLYSIGNIDVTLIAQEPKIGPYAEEMKENIAEALDIENDKINIKGTTTEKLGFAGRKEGIAAEAVCSVYR